VNVEHPFLHVQDFQHLLKGHTTVMLEDVWNALSTPRDQFIVRLSHFFRLLAWTIALPLALMTLLVSVRR
jgi:hypothetical protein